MGHSMTPDDHEDELTEEETRNEERLAVFELELAVLCNKHFGTDWKYRSNTDFAEEGIFILRFFEGRLTKEDRHDA